MQKKIIIGIDLAGTETNPTGLAVWKNKTVSTCLVYKDKEILEHLQNLKKALVATDAPLSLPKEGIMRNADRQMQKRGYPVFPPRFPAMEKLTLRTIRLTPKLKRKESELIEVHPTSTRKALKMPTKDRKKIQAIFIRMGLQGNLKTHVLSPHEIDAITAALTGHLYLQGKTELIGNKEEGYIVLPAKTDWKLLV